MKISVFNGSPRGENSNSSVIIKWITGGIDDCHPQNILRKIVNYNNYIFQMEESDKILIVFPLYTDAMPGIVMKFFEEIYKNRNRLKGKQYLFVVHSGFPETKHSYPVREYLKNFINKVDGELIDVIINGGSEATRLQPEKTQKKKRTAYNRIGTSFEKGNKIDKKDKMILAKPIELSSFVKFLFNIISKIGLLNISWNINLKKNKAFNKRFDKPYI